MRELNVPLKMTKLILPAFLAATTLSQPGCIRLFAKEYVPGLDAEARSFAYVEQARGKVLTLRGGDTVTLDALSVEGMTQHQERRLGSALTEMAPYPHGGPQQGQAYPGMLIRNFMEPSEVVLSVPYADFMLNCCGLRPIDLFPIRVPVPPTRVDVVELVLEAGLAKLDRQAVTDPDKRQRYLKAEDFARTLGLGVWASPGEQLLEAVAAGDVAEVERLLGVGAPLNYVGQPSPDPPRVERHRPYSPSLSPFRWARAYTHEGQTPLMVAAQFGQVDILRILLRHGADANFAVRNPKRPADPAYKVLHCVAGDYDRGPGVRLAMLKALVEAGADVRAADADRRLIHFGHNSQWEVIDFLRAQGASIDTFDPKKHGPRLLAAAAAVGNLVDATRLVGFGADVNGLTDLGEYPLSVAADTGWVEVAKVLLNAGADPSRKDSKGRTPMDHARSNANNSRMIELLAKHGAR
jgi:hypothetical protein